jgi:hypothetical protein
VVVRPFSEPLRGQHSLKFTYSRNFETFAFDDLSPAGRCFVRIGPSYPFCEIGAGAQGPRQQLRPGHRTKKRHK